MMKLRVELGNQECHQLLLRSATPSTLQLENEFVDYQSLTNSFEKP
jgi:hypothetical protein